MTSVGVVWSALARIQRLKNIIEILPEEGEQLQRDLEEMVEILRKREKAEEFGELEKEIVRLSYEIVDAVVDATYKRKKTASITKLFNSSGGNATLRLRQVQGKLNAFKGNLNSSAGAGAGSGSGSTASLAVQKPKINNFFVNTINRLTKTSSANVQVEAKPTGVELEEKGSSEVVILGKEELFDELMKNVWDPRSEHSVVYLVGESGIGKTSFTRKLFEQVKSRFDLSAWVPIHHNFQTKMVLQLLLQKLLPLQNLDISALGEIKLISHIFAQYNNKNSLIVLDGIRTVDDWKCICLAFPDDNSTKVIVTTSSQDFIPLPNSYQIPGFTQHEIRQLLHTQPSFNTTAGSEEVEKAIFDVSNGSPLIAAILGTSLLSKASEANEQQLVEELRSYMPHRGKAQVLNACYKRLAPELKPCLLYLGLFPQGHDIQVEKLYHLLMAENLIIPPKESQVSLQSFKDNLKTLADLKFVQVQEDYKSCRLHDRVREFCISQGSYEEFFQVEDFQSSTSVGPHTRRLAIYLGKNGSSGDNPPIKFESQDTPNNILSLLIFNTFESAVEKSEWPLEVNELKAFTHARVVEFHGVIFTGQKVLKWIDRLELLRYLSFRGCRLVELPSSMSNLMQLETLDLVVDQEDRERMLIPNNLFAKMTRMVNLYLPRLYAASDGKTKVQLQGLESLEILVNFDTEACDVGDLSKFKKLLILSALISRGKITDLEQVIEFINKRGKELQHSSVDIAGFSCYSRGGAAALEKLLKCEFVRSIHIVGRICELLPKKQSRAENIIEEIFLDGSYIEVDPMDYLGKFVKLHSLELANSAFLGSEIVISAADGLFPNLRSMKLHNLKYLEKLTIEGGALPELSTLQIHDCGRLNELTIPKKLNDRLRKEQRDKGGDVYSVVPLPAAFKIRD